MASVLVGDEAGARAGVDEWTGTGASMALPDAIITPISAIKSRDACDGLLFPVGPSFPGVCVTSVMGPISRAAFRTSTDA
ncbi:MAG: hypothetical protein H7A14_00490 [Sinobacteraceae bacterium]|nr:hypothetical protein [Nevskiaceae bacterium]MCP5359192.1 hypothetical protein [Nevskiaceae bacterium]